MNEKILAISNLTVRYGDKKTTLAVNDVTFNLVQGETLGLVGESGSGKSSIARAILGLTPWTGSVMFDGKDMSAIGGKELRSTRQKLQMIFQDPYATLVPRMKIGKQIAEPILAHKLSNRHEVGTVVAELLERVELDPKMAHRFPHEFSGGQRQRIAIARAIGLSPSVIICDEPTSALDVSVQAQILELLQTLQRDQGVSYLFISHNLGVVRKLSHTVAVLYLGEIVEMGLVDEVFDNPQHDYTKALLDAVLEPEILKHRSKANHIGNIYPISNPDGLSNE
jgi:ABC-type glutathione transport system ATPase component